MLDLKASYETVQETASPKPVNTGRFTAKASEKSDGFKRILNKVNQRSQKPKQQETTMNDNNASSKDVDLNPAPVNAKEQSALNVQATVSDDSSKIETGKNGSEKSQSQPTLNVDQDVSVNPNNLSVTSDTSEESPTSTDQDVAVVQISAADAKVVAKQSEPQTDLLSDLTDSEKVVASMQAPDQNNQVEPDAVLKLKIQAAETESIPVETVGQNQTEVKNEAPSQVQAAEQNNQTGSASSDGTQVQAVNQIPVTIAEQDPNQLQVVTETEQNKQSAQVEKVTAGAQTGLSTNGSEPDQISASTMLDNQKILPEATVVAQLIQTPTSTTAESSAGDNPSAIIDNITDSQSGIITEVLNIAEELEKVLDSAAAVSTDTPETSETGEENGKMQKTKIFINTDDLRFKLMEKTLFSNNQKSVQDQPGTDVKKLMLTESQRILAAKPVTEEVKLTDLPAAKSHSDIPLTTTGLEKAMFVTGKAADVQTAGSQPSPQNVNPQELIEQIVQKAEMLSKDSNNEMKIQLKPEFMGKMIIKIAVEDGMVTAKFITESQHVKQTLEANMGTLKQNLESQGLKVDRTEVNVQLDNGGSFHGNDSGRQQMWQEFSDRNASNRNNYQTTEGYQDYEKDSGSSIEPAAVHLRSGLLDGSVDFMV